MKLNSRVIVVSLVTIASGIAQAQGTGGTGTYSGTVPTTFTITNASNGNLSAAMGNFPMLTIGNNSTLSTPTPLSFRLRSNAAYKLTANGSVTSGITDGHG